MFPRRWVSYTVKQQAVCVHACVHVRAYMLDVMNGYKKAKAFIAGDSFMHSIVKRSSIINFVTVICYL